MNDEPAATDAEIIDSLHSVRQEFHRPPTAAEYEAHGPFAVSTIQRRFGSWNAALETAGIEVSKRYDIPDRELLADMQRVADELGYSPSCRDYREHGEFARDTVERRFGGWNAAKEAAGLDVVTDRGSSPLEHLDPEDLGLSPIGARGESEGVNSR